MDDIYGMRCAGRDPVAEVRTYGVPGDPFLMLVDRVDSCGQVEHFLVPRLPAGIVAFVNLEDLFR